MHRILLLLIVLFVTDSAHAQRGARGGPPPTGRASAAIDLTGYWVSGINEDWRLRVVTPPKGQYDALTLNAEGRRVGNTWDPDRDEKAGEQCKAYGAANIMRLPGRLHITWEFGPAGRAGARTGNLKVVTTNLRAGYIRKNGAPHSDKAVITEYYDVNA